MPSRHYIKNFVPYFLLFTLLTVSSYIGYLVGQQRFSSLDLVLTVLVVVLLAYHTKITRRLQRAAYVDCLTGLWNRRYLEKRFSEEVERFNNAGTSFCILMLDIDNLKEINDTLGHEAGDQVIAAISYILQTQTRRQDIAARWGGDEFSIICPGLEIDKARSLAERLRLEIAATTKATVSIGAAEVCPGMTKAFLFRIADYALYKAKKQRNMVVVGCPKEAYQVRNAKKVD